MTIRYRDVSHYQGNYVPIGPTCAKATEGSTYTDPSYAGIRQRTLAGGWPFLAYHFLRPHTIASIASQVAHCISVVGHGQPLMLDVEKEPMDTLAEQRELRDDMYAFADQYAAAGGRVTLAYFPRWQEQAIGSPSLTGLTSRGIGLVSSNYTTYSDTGPGWAAYGGVTPVIWQYTSTPYDTNAFKGTTAELANLWAHGTNSTPEVDMPLTKTDAETLVTADVVPNFPWAADIKTNPTIPLTTAILTAGNQAHAAYQAVGQVVTLLTGLPAAIVAGLPTVGEGSFTKEQIAQIQASVSTSLAGIKVTVSTS